MCYCVMFLCIFFTAFVFFFKQKTAYEMRISDWSSDVCSSDLTLGGEFDAPFPFGQFLFIVKSFVANRIPAFVTAQIDIAICFHRLPQGLAHSAPGRSEEHTSELQSLMRISYAVFCLKKKKKHISQHTHNY